jgi:hypothetical protein
LMTKQVGVCIFIFLYETTLLAPLKKGETGFKVPLKKGDLAAFLCLGFPRLVVFYV